METLASAWIWTSEDVVVSKVGRELYVTFFRGYTRKPWGMDRSELDKSVTARVPTRTNTDDPSASGVLASETLAFLSAKALISLSKALRRPSWWRSGADWPAAALIAKTSVAVAVSGGRRLALPTPHAEPCGGRAGTAQARSVGRWL